MPLLLLLLLLLLVLQVLLLLQEALCDERSLVRVAAGVCQGVWASHNDRPLLISRISP